MVAPGGGAATMMAAMPAVAGATVIPAMAMMAGPGGGGRNAEACDGESGGSSHCEKTHPDILLLMVAGCSPSVTIDTPFGAIRP